MGNIAEIRVGVAGTGFVSRHFTMAFHGRQGLTVSNVLTRRPLGDVTDHPLRQALTRSADELIDRCDVVFECTGDAVAAALRPEHRVGADDVDALRQVACHKIERLDLVRYDVHDQLRQPGDAAQVAQHHLHVMDRNRQHQDFAGGDLG